MKVFFLFILIFISGCASKPAPKPVGPVLRITEISPNKWTGITRQNLEHLLVVYHLAPLLFTKNIQIQSRVIPHSHPVLTLNTRYAEQPHKLLSVFVHEQYHWWAEMRKTQLDKAIVDLKKLFPVLPKEGLAKDTYSTYLHLIICFLEYETMIYYVKKNEANKILKDLIYKDKIYVWIYKQVYLKYKELNAIVTKHQLKPPLLMPPVKELQKPTKKPPFSSAKRRKNL